MDMAKIKEAVESVVFHYFCCNDGDGDGCGYLRRDMAKLAKLVGFENDPATNAVIEALLALPPPEKD